MKKRAILCTAGTENLLELAQYLISAGWELISTGSSGKLLADSKIPYKEAAALFDTPRSFSDYMSLYRSILTTGQQQEKNCCFDEYLEINLVCINITPSFKTVTEVREFDASNDFIDIRCSTLVEAACKNYKNVLILTDPDDYGETMIQLKTESISTGYRLYLAGKAFNMISACNGAAANTILHQSGKEIYSRYFTVPYKKALELKCGAARQQSAGLYLLPESTGSMGGIKKLQGREIPYSLYINIDAVWKGLCLFSSKLKNAAAVSGTDCEGNPIVTQFTPAAGSVYTYSVKHGIPVSAALGSNAAESYRKMFNCGKAALNDATAGFSSVVDDKAAQELVSSKLCAVIAPGFTPEARVILAARKDMRLISMSKPALMSFDFRSLDGGLLIESTDTVLFEKWNFVTKTRPIQQQIDEMAFGQLILTGAKQDAAVVVKDMTTTGMCCAAMLPEDACFAALDHAVKNVQEGLTGSPVNADVLICGSVLPFSPELRLIAERGIRAILQPGGVQNDQDFISFCNDHNIAMVFTGIEHPGI
ncbi:MAG: hypothetical protein M0P01_10045 [Treponema sp.]|nr:hypothetical protein [Treponema sp.]